MYDDVIPVKTAAGRQEIEQRSLRLGQRHRTVLIAINGERKLDAVRRQFEAFGDVTALIGELAEAGLIEFLGPAANDVRAPAVVAVPTVEPAKPPAPAAVAVAVHAEAPALSPLAQARQFMIEAVQRHLGLRAFLLPLKLEKCASARDLRELLPEVRRQLRKVLDNAGVNGFSEQAEALIARI
ncbi:MAG: hypothetical protein J0L88_14780 [Xanthomonadales bacterium]|nr:hypothetical protein [Xanthomonadales bacterium]